jgi:histidyl-tRNA synthetase
MRRELGSGMGQAVTLTEAEMKQTHGGGRYDSLIISLVTEGVKYFYNMGFTEARRYRGRL